MGDQTNAVVFEPEEGQPQVQQPQQPVTGAPDTAQPKYITLEDAQRLAADAAKQAEEAAFRRAQGYFDKGQSRVRERLDGLTEHLKLMTSAGVQVTPEQERIMRQRALEDAFQPDPAPAASPGAQPGPKPVTTPPDPVTADAWGMMQKAGVYLEDGDPETDSLDQSHGPYAFLRSVEKAIDAKRQRTGQVSPETPQNVVQPQVPARSPTNVGGTGVSTDPILSNMDADDLITRGLNLK